MGDFDAGEWIRRLNDADVDYVLVGGLSISIRGVDYQTRDIDVVPDFRERNLERLCSVLRDVNAHLARGPGSGAISGDDITPELLNDREVTNWSTDIGVIDVMWAIGPDNETPWPFDDLDTDAEVHHEPTTGLPVQVASLERVKAAKRNAGRPKDHIALRAVDAFEQARQSGRTGD